MATDGHTLEQLVRTVEEFFLPKGCTVDVRKRIYGETGAQLAELDILITGRLGTTEIRWLIECRDRPSDGRAPAAWIEQLAGRQDLHGFNKVTAVSTTGFAEGASEMAEKAGIELRTVSDASPADVANWFRGEKFIVHNVVTVLEHAAIFPLGEETLERKAALDEKLKAMAAGRSNDPFLRTIKTDAMVTVPDAFTWAVNNLPELYSDLVPDNPEGRTIHLEAQYPNDDDHFVIDTSTGPVRIKMIRFSGRLKLKVQEVALAALKTYKRDDAAGSVISQAAIFPIDVEGRPPLSFELHNIAETGETHVIVRLRSPSGR